LVGDIVLKILTLIIKPMIIILYYLWKFGISIVKEKNGNV